METFMQQWAASDCGDGALVRGGEQAKHPSTAAMDTLWEDVAKANDNARWDAFHQLNVAGSQALTLSAMMTKFSNVLKRQEHLFALGQGKVLRSSLAEHLDQPDLRIMAMCGHRKLGYLSGVPARWLKNYRVDYDA